MNFFQPPQIKKAGRSLFAQLWKLEDYTNRTSRVKKFFVMVRHEKLSRKVLGLVLLLIRLPLVLTLFAVIWVYN